VKQAITQLGLDYRLMTQFTSFVAVEEMIVTDGGQPRRIDVPVEVPEGVNRAGVFGQESDRPMNGAGFGGIVESLTVLSSAPAQRVVTKSAPKTKRAAGGGGGIGEGQGNGRGSGSSSTQSGSVAGVASTSPANGAFSIDGSREADALKVLSPEELKRTQLQSKFHPSLLAVIDRLKAKASPGPDEAKFIRNGKAEIQIWLTDKSDETMAKLKELGFEVVLDPKTAKLVIGRLSIEKLAALAELKSVRYVAPQM
jgi:Ca-activated chloride channel homolog